MTETANALEYTPRSWISDWLTTPATPGDPLTITHELGRIPTGASIHTSRENQAAVWHKEVDEQFWTTSSIRLRFTPANLEVRVEVKSKD